MEKLKKLYAKIQKGNVNKSIQNLIIIGLIGIALILAGSFFFDTSEEQSNPQNTETPVKEANILDYESKVKYELETILSSIEGVGNVEIMLTIKNEGESEIAYSNTQSESETKEKDTQGGERVTDQKDLSNTPVMNNAEGGNEPFVIQEKKPEVKGVMVVAEGADDPDIKYQLGQAVQTVLDLPSHKVAIYAKKQ